METKFFEVRDVGTFISVKVDRICKDDHVGKEKFLIWRAGIGQVYVMTCLHTFDSWHDYFKIPSSSRTYREAYRLIKENWNTLNSGDVVDVAYALGQRTTQCESEYKGQYD